MKHISEKEASKIRIHLTPEHIEVIPRMYGITKKEFAEICGVTIGHVSNMAYRRNLITNEMSDTIVERLGINLEVLEVLNAMIHFQREFKKKMGVK